MGAWGGGQNRRMTEVIDGWNKELRKALNEQEPAEKNSAHGDVVT